MDGLGNRTYRAVEIRHYRLLSPARQFDDGQVELGQLCTVAPVDAEELDVGDIVLCKVNGCEYLHLIKAIQGARFQIGNNQGRINGWVSANSIFG